MAPQTVREPSPAGPLRVTLRRVPLAAGKHGQTACDRGRLELLSLVTFFAAAKKVTAAPHRGSANRPPRNRDPAKKTKTKEISHKTPALPAIAIAAPLR